MVHMSVTRGYTFATVDRQIRFGRSTWRRLWPLPPQNFAMQSLFLRSATRITFSAHRLGSLRFLTQEVRAKIDGAVKTKPLVLFMKGTPELPQCGFSRAVVQILDLHGVAPEKIQS